MSINTTAAIKQSSDPTAYNPDTRLPNFLAWFGVGVFFGLLITVTALFIWAYLRDWRRKRQPVRQQQQQQVSGNAITDLPLTELNSAGRECSTTEGADVVEVFPPWVEEVDVDVGGDAEGRNSPTIRFGLDMSGCESKSTSFRKAWLQLEIDLDKTIVRKLASSMSV